MLREIPFTSQPAGCTNENLAKVSTPVLVAEAAQLLLMRSLSRDEMETLYHIADNVRPLGVTERDWDFRCQTARTLKADVEHQALRGRYGGFSLADLAKAYVAARGCVLESENATLRARIAELEQMLDVRMVAE